jgi:hypothetical protein
MTEAVVDQRNTVLTAGFANPLNLPANAEVASHIKVYGDDELLTNGVDYTLAGVGDLEDLDGIDGVDATIDADVIIADLYDTFTIEHDPPLDQDADLSGGGQFGIAFENAVDAIVRRLQSLGSKIERSLHLPTSIATDDVDTTLPIPEPGMSLKWNEDGTALVNSLVDPDTGTADVDAIAALVQPTLEANLLDEIAAAEAAAEADRVAAAASAAAAALSETAAELAETNAEAAEVAAEAAQAAAEAAAGANSTVEDQIVAAATSSTPADGDKIGVVDVSAANVLKGWTFTVIKAFLKTYFDTLYSAIGHTHSFASLTSKPTTLSGFGITDAINNDGSAGERYTYAFCYTTTNIGNGFGGFRAGSQLRPCNSDDAPATGSTLAGTWECRGTTANGAGDMVVTLWYRT